MATKILSLLFAAGFFWSSVRTKCSQSKCKFRSINRFHNNKTHSLLKVQVGSGSHGIAFVGGKNENNLTEFLVTRCPSEPTLFGLDYTIQWSLRPSFTLAEKSGKVVLEATNITHDSHRFHYRLLHRSRQEAINIFTLRSKSKVNRFLMAHGDGQLNLTTRRDPRAQLKMTCVRLQ